MSAKAEFIFILCIAIGFPVLTYPLAYSFFQKPNPESMEDVMYVPVAHEEISKPVSLLFIGDIMLDRTIRKNGEVQGYSNLFSCLKEEFAKHDAVIGNLEGTVTDFESVSRDAPYEAPESFRFTFDIDAVRALTDIGLSIVSIGNNHIRDYGDDGIAQTLEKTRELGLVTFGDPRPNGRGYAIETIGKTKVAFIAYNQFFGTQEQTIEDLRQSEPLSDLQIIFSHWGDEYVPARSDTKAFARRLVDQGADLIIGTHPHVIQEKEMYKDAWIYYSLGNFIFDQYWEEAVSTGLAVNVIIEKDRIKELNESKVKSRRNAGSCFE